MKPLHLIEYGLSTAIVAFLFISWTVAIAWLAGFGS
jgi:hypothetical protein